ncbi:MAG TPA: uridine diphosphate-N-acetylglucosamine-binding protein YvcK [Bryobacteraceae bacterium]|nr:uridine diphosphate-N-acetylglucosamine-binding protein YvcK [Bryobacteraceae bacterium]
MQRQTSRDEALRIVAIGGGNGLSALLQGLKQIKHCGPDGEVTGQEIDVTAVVTVADDGGSSGRLRREFGVLPPGDIRNCLVALSEDEALLSRLFQYRFASGKGLKGHTLGNLFLTALTDLYDGDFARAVQHAAEVLASCGRIYPSTSAKVALEAELAGGKIVRGESKISRSKARIERVRLCPEAPEPLPETLHAIETAHVITLGPGSLFTSIIPNLLVAGIGEAIARSSAVKVYFVNLMWQPGETSQFTAADHVRAINEHAGKPIIDVAVVNTSEIPALLQERYRAQQALPVEDDLSNSTALCPSVITGDFAARGDRVRHDQLAIAKLAIQLGTEARKVATMIAGVA